MTRDEEHALKMNFIRQFQGAVPVKRRRAPVGGKEIRHRLHRPVKGDVSLSLGVHSSHVETARALTKAAGLSGIDFANDGTCIVSDEKHKMKYAKLIGKAAYNSLNGS